MKDILVNILQILYIAKVIAKNTISLDKCVLIYSKIEWLKYFLYKTKGSYQTLVNILEIPVAKKMPNNP